MAVIAEKEFGWLISPEVYFNIMYKSCRNDNSVVQLVLKNDLFNIRTPFFTNSMSKKIGRMLHSKDTEKIKRIRKKKKIIPKNQLDDSEIIIFIEKNIKDFITAAKGLQHLENSEITPEEWFENNSKARGAASEILNHVNTSLDLNSELHYENSSLSPIIKKFGSDKYVLPPQSTFHLCDITSFLSTVDEKYDLIVIDPPWVNRSVKRKSSYCSLKYEFLGNMPFEKLVNPGCLIVVWITNSSSAASFVLEELFPKCNVTLSSMWHWCKVTKKGDFVYPIESHHKKPYENLILGRVQYDDKDLKMRPSREIDSKKLIISVPSSIHSHKPPLVEILKPYVKPDACCLELFARYLLPGWRSVGNEVLKLQNVKLFDILLETND